MNTTGCTGSINVELQGGFGNHLLAYFLGCILSHKYNVKISLISNEISNDMIAQRSDTRTTIFKVVNEQHITPFTGNGISINTVDMYNDLLSSGLDKHENYTIHLIGADSISFYVPYIDIISTYIVPDIFNMNVDTNNSIIVSLRLGMGAGEVAQPSPFEGELRLPFKYYRDAINRCLKLHPNATTLIILSDNYSSPYIEQFQEFKGLLQITHYSNKNTYEQFKCIINAKFFISSNSTFSLIGALLNRKGTVMIPNFIDSDSPYPGSANARYSTILNIGTPNSIKVSIV
jgi:hypothetical protein